MLAYDSTLRVPARAGRCPVSPPGGRRSAGVAGGAGRDAAAAGWSFRARRHARGVAPRWSTTDARKSYAETQYPRSAGWHSLAALADDRWKLIQSSELELYDLAERSRRAQQPRVIEGQCGATRCGNVSPRSAASEHRRRRLFLPMRQSACARWATSPVRPQDPPTARPRRIPRSTSPRGTRSSGSSRG